MDTWSPDVAVAIGVYVAPPTAAPVGALVLGVTTSTIDRGRTTA
jgi:hypothetical protein